MFERFAALLTQYNAQGAVPRRVGRKEKPSHVLAGAPAGPEEIAAVERRLGCSLPADYRAFLARWNGARLFAFGGADHPCLFDTAELLPQPALLEDPRVLTIGMLDDEAFLVLDRRAPHAAHWPVHWADELDGPDQVLARPPIAGGVAEFLDRFVAAAGQWYWESPEPLQWYKDPDTPGLWRHGLGLHFALFKYARYYFQLGLPQLPHAMTAPAAMIALGIRDHLLALGASFGPPPEVMWDPGHPTWMFGFDEANRPKVRPADIPPATIAGEGWQEVAPGLWVHGGAGTCFWSKRANTHAGGAPTGTYVLTWPLGAEKAAEPLHERLSQLGMYAADPERLPPEHDGVEFHWWKHGAAPPEIFPG